MPKKNQLALRNTQQVRTIVSGTMVGAFAGLIAAFLLTRRAKRQGREVALTPAEGIQILVLLFGLLRAIAAIGNDK
jgi:hypothetical protein